MAQAKISDCFPSKKKRDDNGEHGPVKRRKLSVTSTSHQDLPCSNEQIPSGSLKASRTHKPTGKKRATKKAKTKGQRSLQDLFDIIAASSTAEKTSDITPSTPLTLSRPSTPLTSSRPATPLTASHPITPSTPLTLSRPVTPSTSSRPTTPSKRPPIFAPSILPTCQPTLPATTSSTSLTRTPISPSQMSRGATLLKLAQLKSPNKKQPSPVKNQPSPIQKSLSPVKKLFSSAKKPPGTQTRSEMVKELHRISAQQLALPTPREKEKKAPVIEQFRILEIPSPQKESRVPAYKRYQSLAEPTSSSVTSDLPLPPTYSVLAEKFRCTDTVVNMLQKRLELASFGKIKKAVQDMCRRNFEQGDLAQMKTVYPTAFTFRQEKSIPGSYNASHQLTVECVTENGSRALQPTDLVKRRKVFHNGLILIVREHHRKFLSTLDPPLTIPEDKVLRWHPEFILDNVPNVVEASLPQPPFKERYTGAADMLRDAGARLTARVTSALSAASQEVDKETTPTQAPPVDPALKGISQDLLDKIRAKEAAKAQAIITRDPLKEHQLKMVERLPEFVRILRCLFVGEKKAALLWDDVVSKVCDSTFSRMSPEKVEAHLNYLTELVPDWMSLLTLSKKRYLKMNKTTNIKHILKTISLAENTLKQ